MSNNKLPSATPATPEPPQGTLLPTALTSTSKKRAYGRPARRIPPDPNVPVPTPQEQSLADKLAAELKVAEKALTLRQRKFAAEYLKDLNATRAALRCGYSKRRAPVSGSEILNNRNVQAYLSALVAADQRDAELLRRHLSDGLLEIYNASPLDFATVGADGVTYHDVGPDHPQRRAIAEISSKTEYDKETGDTGKGRIVTKIKLHDKLKAGEMLAKLHGLYAPQTIQLSVEAQSAYGGARGRGLGGPGDDMGDAIDVEWSEL